MRQLAPYAILFCLTAVNAETVDTNSPSSLPATSEKIQQAAQSIASRLVSILGLTTVSRSEQDSVALKSVVVTALNEGKTMKEIRLATSQAVEEVTGRAFLAEAPSSASVSPVSAVATQSVALPQSPVTVNLSEVAIDPETGNKLATVLPGESIYRLAQRVYGKENGRKYLEIFAANRNEINNINVVVEGQVLVMP